MFYIEQKANVSKYLHVNVLNWILILMKSEENRRTENKGKNRITCLVQCHTQLNTKERIYSDDSLIQAPKVRNSH